MKIPIAFQGQIGSYSQQAVIQFGEQNGFDFEGYTSDTFDTLFSQITGDVGLGLVPIENSTHGLVFPAMDLLLKHDLRIIGDHYLSVDHMLLGHSSNDLEGKVVHSHPQAIGQCNQFIKSNGMLSQLENDTAGAARWVAQLEGEERYKHLAIAGEQAAKEYSLQIIKRNIQDVSNNTTRFLLVRPSGRKSVVEDELLPVDARYKATVQYNLPSWDLWKPLQLVAEAGFRTNVIHTRPVRDDGDFIFSRVYYSDIGIISKSLKTYAQLLNSFDRELGKEAVKIMGIYPAAEIQPRV